MNSKSGKGWKLLRAIVGSTGLANVRDAGSLVKLVKERIPAKKSDHLNN